MPRVDHMAEPARSLRDLSKSLDNSIPADGQLLTWIRVTKVAEEAGEVIDALNGVEGTNPRKGVTHTWDDVGKELLDVAATALLAWEHLNQNEGFAMVELAAHAKALLGRHQEQVDHRRVLRGEA